ncbi:epoxyqueuosine reductase QueH [Clostridium niameyense]|uniref:Epoxyqueuosine reductase QueH n=1 Tax=Clostridium niameyense TaxID=1622073 RepID=A0A6M0RAI1_9CLOT|nr:epoxyqueuosine reductase QueH [Clostridium niameyense]NEZ46228.1 epoxyqueuosine reductase QueH [Clostridium niameyense]
MNANINFQKKLDSLIENLEENNEIPKLLLHSCCAPCSSYVLEYLSSYFKITVFYYNPNIYPKEEYLKRVEEQKQFILSINTKYAIDFIEGKYDSDKFYEMAKGMENGKEGGERCFKCYELRLRESAVIAKEAGYDYFTTTLSISPYKNAKKLNEIGEMLSKKYGVNYLYSDFKKKNGYKRSIELSNEYNLYRQDYCGCVFSKNERDSYKNTVTK